MEPELIERGENVIDAVGRKPELGSPQNFFVLQSNCSIERGLEVTGEYGFDDPSRRPASRQEPPRPGRWYRGRPSSSPESGSRLAGLGNDDVDVLRGHSGDAASLAVGANRPERFESARAAQGFEDLIKRPRVDRDHDGDGASIGGEYRFALALELVANLFGPSPKIPNRDGFHGKR